MFKLNDIESCRCGSYLGHDNKSLGHLTSAVLDLAKAVQYLAILFANNCSAVVNL